MPTVIGFYADRISYDATCASGGAPLTYKVDAIRVTDATDFVMRYCLESRAAQAARLALFDHRQTVAVHLDRAGTTLTLKGAWDGAMTLKRCGTEHCR